MHSTRTRQAYAGQRYRDDESLAGRKIARRETPSEAGRRAPRGVDVEREVEPRKITLAIGEREIVVEQVGAILARLEDVGVREFQDVGDDGAIERRVGG